MRRSLTSPMARNSRGRPATFRTILGLEAPVVELVAGLPAFHARAAARDLDNDAAGDKRVVVVDLDRNGGAEDAIGDPGIRRNPNRDVDVTGVHADPQAIRRAKRTAAANRAAAKYAGP